MRDSLTVRLPDTLLHGQSRGSLTSKQLDELLDGESGVGDDATGRAGSKLLVVGNNDPCVRLVAAKHHVAAGLTAEDETGAPQGSANFTAG